MLIARLPEVRRRILVTAGICTILSVSLGIASSLAPHSFFLEFLPGVMSLGALVCAAALYGVVITGWIEEGAKT